MLRTRTPRHSLVAGDVRVNEKRDQATVRIDRRGSDDLVVEACRQLRVDPQPAWAAHRAGVGSVSYVMGEVLQDIVNGSSVAVGGLGLRYRLDDALPTVVVSYRISYE